jgi:hypothetical protein
MVGMNVGKFTATLFQQPPLHRFLVQIDRKSPQLPRCQQIKINFTEIALSFNFWKRIVANRVDVKLSVLLKSIRVVEDKTCVRFQNLHPFFVPPLVRRV